MSDPDPSKRAIARTAGAHEVLDPTDAESVAKLAGSVRSIIDFVGGAATALQGIEALSRGGTYVLVGLLGGEITLPLPPIALRPISIVGSLTGSLEELRELIALAKSGALTPFDLEIVPREDVNVAIDRLRSGHLRGRLVLACAER